MSNTLFQGGEKLRQTAPSFTTKQQCSGWETQTTCNGQHFKGNGVFLRVNVASWQHICHQFLCHSCRKTPSDLTSWAVLFFSERLFTTFLAQNYCKRL